MGFGRDVVSEIYKCLIFPRISIRFPPTPIGYFDHYFDLYFDLGKGRISSFGVLDKIFQGHDVVFLHPVEVSHILRIRVLIPRLRGFKIIDGLRSAGDIRDIITKSRSFPVFISEYLTVNVLEDIKFSKNRNYIYGKLGKVVEKISYSDLIGRSFLVWRRIREFSPPEVVDILVRFLFMFYVKFPLFTYGLVLIEERGWISTLSPDTLLYVYPADLKEFRVFTFSDTNIPVVVVRSLRFQSFDEGEYERNLSDYLSMFMFYIFYWKDLGVEF